MNKISRIIITPGEPAGIGFDLVVLISQKIWRSELVICCDPDILVKRAKDHGIKLKLHFYNKNLSPKVREKGELTIIPIKVNSNVTRGILNINNSYYVINTLTRACLGCINKEFSALVTGPVHKGIIKDSGIKFIGHTEFLAGFSLCKNPVMMLMYNSLRIALATNHIPIKDISKCINFNLIRKKLIVIFNSLRNIFKINNPCIYVCGLNPHAGESGHIGTEEINIIQPAISSLKYLPCKIIGPISADSIFQQKYLKDADAILAMYHDQGLPMIKYIGFRKSVNITLGLPFIRTSVDHGTALNIKNLNEISSKSMEKAISLAIDISQDNSIKK
ncbi:pdxA [Wigglesworthia glossinidia endosymbiont of Glossina brevipalpis]|uniref:4-hydroxythreonine-4-phosphate dehydrogenase n=1 Tax=Wigglesworthia glossinidia brevipalpis TaxID=36870 RepID=PDXA_WIGBR|nr:RecName: Full=4-hydroxythreonine-4-phosphate dehydrogenase; AltName: Full=4-(phosphohydroxy)-L-threonine dehydrogenase [Wigglesworthia glossinidia endosymbiont of Glossina brevipalpis]BAC24165.1 pdxA [Wigglesworthia glossinidia endosymbiont of Glossina brevipalpis]